MTTHAPRVYVVVLNWNGWRDTIECLESVFNSDYDNFAVIVCDNGSHDQSISHILRWAAGEEISAPASRDERVARLTGRSVGKPIDASLHRLDQVDEGPRTIGNKTLVILDCGENRGYAAGNNAGLRFAQRTDDFAYAWILNNDTVVDSHAMRFLVRKMASDPRVGLCGSRVMEYHHPDRVQACGGFIYNKWFGRFRLIEPRAFPRLREERAVEAAMFGVHGSSVFVSAPCLFEVGFMCEDYHLYFEEQDWAMRVRRRFRLGYAADAVVFHKIGAATAADGGVSVYRYLLRSRLMFTRKFFRYAVPTVYLALVAETVKRLLKGDWTRSRMAVSALLRD